MVPSDLDPSRHQKPTDSPCGVEPKLQVGSHRGIAKIVYPVSTKGGASEQKLEQDVPLKEVKVEIEDHRQFKSHDNSGC